MTSLTAIKERKKQTKEYRSKLKQLEEELAAVSQAISVADSSFNEVCDPSLTDALIFDKAAQEARYNYLLKELRALTSNAK